MITLEHKAFFWKEFDENKNPIDSKECQIIFNPKDGGKLTFLLSLDEEYDENKYEKSISKLYGIAKNGKRFTLENLKLIKSPLCQIHRGLELTELRYSIEYIFYGGWGDFEDRIEVMHIRYSYLELFFNQMKLKRPFNDNDKTIASVMIQKESLECSSAGYDVLFNILNNDQYESFNKKRVTYEATNSLAIAKKEDFTIDESRKFAYVLKSFFEILTFYSNNKIFIEDFYIMYDKTKIAERINILFQQHDYEEEKRMSYLDFLFQYSAVKDNIVEILNNWIKNHRENKNEYEAFCNVIADKTSQFNIYSHYFQLVSALEAYHRLQNKENEKQDEQKHHKYLEKLKTQLSCLSSKEKNKLLCKLKYAYGTNFEKRLINLVEISCIKEIIVCDETIHENVIQFIKDMRNKVAHLNSEIEMNPKVKSSFEYLKLIALLIMLKDISLNHAKISQDILDMNIKYITKRLIDTFQVI